MARINKAISTGSVSNITVSVKDHGAVGDGSTDDRAAIQAAADELTSAGGGELIFPDSSGDYLVSGHITFGGDTVVTFTGGSYIKITANSDGGFLKVAAGSRITFNNPLVDGNNLAGQNGIGTASNAKVTVNGGQILNFPVAGDYTGGKGIASDGWGAYLTVNGTTFENCHSAINVKRDEVTDSSSEIAKISISNVIANDCDMFAYFGIVNSTSNDGVLFSANVTGFELNNCGSLGGVFVFNRATNVNITGGSISADSSYNSSTPVDAIFRGRGRKITVGDVQINQSADAIIDIDPLANYAADTSAMADNKYDVVATGTYDYIYKSDLTDSTHANRFLNNTRINTILKNDVSTSIVTAATRNGNAILDVSLGDKRCIGRASRFNSFVTNMAAIATSTTEMFDTELDHPTDTTANISDAAASINTIQKRAGKQVFNTTNNTLYISSGSGPTSAWYVADGSTSITPS